MAILGITALVSVLSLAVVVFVAPPAAASGSPADRYSVINGTANAATDHEIGGSSAFPNFQTGAVDNYYTMAHSYVDNSPFAEGTASPADTGPIGQTVAAGNFAQPQYADARWSGQKSDQQSFGNQGGPYANATADTFKATAESQEASAPSSSPSNSKRMKTLAAPKGLSRRLRVALKAWKAKWVPRLGLKLPGVPVPKVPVPSVPVPKVPVPTPTVPKVTVPTVSVPTLVPLAAASSTPTTTASTTTTPSPIAPTSSTTSSTGSTGTSTTPSSSSPGSAVFGSSTMVQLDPTSAALVTTGESSLGRVSIGGQIVIAGIDVSATITNDGQPNDKIAVDVGAATIGGVPVTIDQNGVQVAGQNQDLSQVYQQADDALNSVLKQAGVQLFTVVPEVKKSANQETITASGVHVIFTQAVHQGGVPDQNVEHILGEVFVDSLAVPGVPLGSFNAVGGGSASGSGKTGLAAGSGASSGGLSSGGLAGSGSSSFPTSSGSSSSLPGSGSTGSASQSGPTELVSALSKPLWLLISYFVWQALVIATGASLWRWRMGGAA